MLVPQDDGNSMDFGGFDGVSSSRRGASDRHAHQQRSGPADQSGFLHVYVILRNEPTQLFSVDT